VNENRNLLLAIVLSALVLLSWTFLSERFVPTANKPSTKIVDGKSVPLPKSTPGPVAQAPGTIRDRALVLAESPRVAIETPRLKGSLDLRGARLDDLVLPHYRESIAKNAPPVRLLSPAGTADAYFGGFGWTGDGIAIPGPQTIWTASSNRLAPGSPVTLSWDNGQGQLFQIKLAVDDHYMFAIDQSVTNRGTGPVSVRPYSLISRTGVSKDPDSWTMHVGPIGVFGSAANYDTDFSDLDDEGKQQFATTGGWLGFGDKYWLTAIVPDQQSAIEAAFRHGSGKLYQADFAAPAVVLGPGKTTSYPSRFFAGAKEIKLLENYTDTGGIELFDRAIDWGWFRWFEKPIFYVLDWLFKLIGNFGVAIMCLTVMMRALMFPIAQKQFASMAGMRVLQPKMKALQERHKDDKPRLQQEMLKLYKDEKVNPMAGCLPIVIQIPVWYALYKVLMLAIEMRHQPFALWIKDMSAPDPLTPVNLFGFLPFLPPPFLAIGVLPIIVAITMFLQFKLNPQPTDPVQQQMFSIMPWVLMFVMAPFAAGLQLYWATSNILTIAQQKWLYSRYPAMKAAAQNK
jgi:YidC/Oxa1 family membrane protein insertase